MLGQSEDADHRGSFGVTPFQRIPPPDTPCLSDRLTASRPLRKSEYLVNKFVRISIKRPEDVQELDDIQTPQARLVLGHKRLRSPHAVRQILLEPATFFAQFDQQGGDILVARVLDSSGH